MRADYYASYLQLCVTNYAEGNVTSGYWLKEGALERAYVEFEKMLPQGLATPDNYFFEIMSDEGGYPVGFIWFTVKEEHRIRSSWLCYVEIKAEFRRQGYARKAFHEFEVFVAALGVSSIGLHVFSHNNAAQAFYSQIGFVVPGINMVKQLGKHQQVL
ncbi:MAG: GNAT family N-acetyltransferase [Methyloglobulus sp.]